MANEHMAIAHTPVRRRSLVLLTTRREQLLSVRRSVPHRLLREQWGTRWRLPCGHARQGSFDFGEGCGGGNAEQAAEGEQEDDCGG
jgi:hypothetical protein